MIVRPQFISSNEVCQTVFHIELNENEMIFYFFLITFYNLLKYAMKCAFMSCDTSCELEGSINEPKFSIKFREFLGFE